MDNKLTFITVKEFSKKYNIGIKKTYDLCKKEGFPAIKNGSRYMIISEKVDEFFENYIGNRF